MVSFRIKNALNLCNIVFLQLLALYIAVVAWRLRKHSRGRKLVSDEWWVTNDNIFYTASTVFAWVW